jgi:hypothetical protein
MSGRPQCPLFILAYLMMVLTTSGYSASNHHMILNTEPKGTLTIVLLSQFTAGSLKGYKDNCS